MAPLLNARPMPRTMYRRLLLLDLTLLGALGCSLEGDGLNRTLEGGGGGRSDSPTPGSGRMPTVGLDGGPMILPTDPPSPPPIDPIPPGQSTVDAGVPDPAPEWRDAGAGGPGTAAGRALGETCGGAGDCQTGNCVDGVCCASGCQGVCESCALPESRGRCTPVVGPPQGNRPRCMGAGPPCGGSCDGRDGSRCTYPGEEVECMPASCVPDEARTPATCTGTGVCGKRIRLPCQGAGCAGGRCVGGCGPD